MAATTGQLGLVTPTQGDLSGVWGDTVNNGITEYTNIAIAGTLTLTGDGAVTLQNTTGNNTTSNITSTLTGAGTVTAQFAIVRVTGTLTTAKIITGPSYSKTYLVVNAATGSTVSFIRSGQTPAISIAVGESALVYFNGTDYVKLTGTATAGAAGGSTTQVQFNSSGVLAGSANLTFDGTILTSAGFAGPLNGTVGATTANTGAFTTLAASSTVTLSGGTANGVTYLNGSKVLTSGTALTFDGNTFNFSTSYLYPNVAVTSTGNSAIFGFRLNNTGTGGQDWRVEQGRSAVGDFNISNQTNSTIPFKINENANNSTFATTLNAYQFVPTGSSVPSNGMYLPSANNVAFAINSAEGMRLTSTGLGIGTSSPDTRLTVLKNSNADFSSQAALRASSLQTFSNTNVTTAVVFNGLTGNPDKFISVDNQGGTQYFSLGYLNGSTKYNVYQFDQNGGLYLSTNATERLRITSAGAWGLSGANYGTSGQVLTSGGSGAAPTWTTVGGGSSQWTTSGTQIYYTTGNVGIGTTSPDTYTDGGKNLTVLSSTASTRANLALVGTQSSANEILGRLNFTNTNSTNTAYRVAMIDGIRGSDNNSGYLTFSTGYTTAASERMRIDEFGNVAINNITPTSFGKFSVRGAISVSGVPGQTSGHFSDASSGSIFITHASGVVTLNSDTALAFGSSLSEKARIDTSGRFMVGTTTALASANFSVDGTNSDYLSRFYNSNASPAGTLIYYSGAAPNGTTSWFLKCQDNSAERMYVRSNGGIGNYQGNDVNLSDRREKTNFAPAKNYLDIICAIPIQTFNYIDQNHKDDPGLTLGAVAQDVQKVAPEFVMESNWGTEKEPKMRLSIYQTDLQYALMKCIQEQQAIIESLKARLDAANL